jgi:hypothetical protein
MILSRRIRLRMRNVSDKTVETVTPHISCSTDSVPALYCLWENVGKHSRAGQATDNNILRRTRFTCRITKVGIHTLIICNTYCFQAPTMVTRTRLDVTSYVGCLSSSFVTTALTTWSQPHALASCLEYIYIYIYIRELDVKLNISRLHDPTALTQSKGIWDGRQKWQNSFALSLNSGIRLQCKEEELLMPVQCNLYAFLRKPYQMKSVLPVVCRDLTGAAVSTSEQPLWVCRGQSHNWNKFVPTPRLSSQYTASPFSWRLQT